MRGEEVVRGAATSAGVLSRLWQCSLQKIDGAGRAELGLGLRLEAGAEGGDAGGRRDAERGAERVAARVVHGVGGEAGVVVSPRKARVADAAGGERGRGSWARKTCSVVVPVFSVPIWIIARLVMVLLPSGPALPAGERLSSASGRLHRDAPA